MQAQVPLFLIGLGTLVYCILAITMLPTSRYTWRPHVEIIKAMLERSCKPAPPQHPMLAPLPADSVPAYLLNGRKDPVNHHILSSLDPLNVTIYRPLHNPDPRWACRVTRGHAHMLEHAFGVNQDTDTLLILEDDAMLADVGAFEQALAYYRHTGMSFYSLIDTYGNRPDTCNVYHYSTAAYLISRKFYESIRHNCLINCERALDTCLESLYVLYKTPTRIFRHGTLPTSKLDSVVYSPTHFKE